MKKFLTFFTAIVFCASFSLAQDFDLLFEQPYYDGGTAATSAYDPDSEVDYEVADNFWGLNDPIEEIIFYGLTLKFIDGVGWQEQVPDDNEPFSLRFYDYIEQINEGLLAPTTGTYQIALLDSYGDGWNNGLVTVFINGEPVLVDLTLPSGPGPEYHDFEANQGDEISTVYTPGSWAYENYYAIIDPDENIIAEDGGTWDNPGASTPTGIAPGGELITLEPDWANPLASQAVVADVESVGPIWGGDYTLYKFTATLNAPVDLEEAWVSAQIDAPNGSGTWFLWLNSEEGDGVSWQRLTANKTFGRGMVSRTSLSFNGNNSFTRDQLAYDMAFELWGGELTEPPPCATNPFPTHLAENVSSNPTFSWTGSAVATGYLISIGDGINPLNPFNIEFRTDLGNVTSYNLELPLEYNTGYQWRVIPYNTAGEATGCPIWTFETMDDPTITDFPYFQDFEEEDFPPAGWTWVNGISGSYWERSSVHSYTGTHSARSYQGAASGNLADEWLITPLIDMDNPEAQMLTFYGLSSMAPDGTRENMRILAVDQVYDNVNDLHNNAILLQVIPFEGSWSNHIVDISSLNGEMHLVFNYYITPEDNAVFNWIYVDHVMVGNFDTFTLTMMEPVGNGTVTPEVGDHLFMENTEVSLEAAADHTWEFDRWEVNGDFYSDEASTTITITSDVDVQAIFVSLESYTLTMEEPEGMGSVIPEVGIHNYLLDEEVTLSAFPAQGWEFSHWTGAVVDPEASITSIIMDTDHTVRAHFSPIAALGLPYLEDFTGVPTGELPVNWFRTHTNWSVQNTANAGGAAPELRFSWTPSATDLFRVMTPPLDATGETEVTLTFMHSVNDYSGGYTLKVQTSLDGETWADQWVLSVEENKDRNNNDRSLPGREDIPPTELSLVLDGVEGEEFFVAFVFEGNSFNINFWYIDNILVGEPPEKYEATFIVTESTMEQNPVEGALVQIQGATSVLTDLNGQAVFELIDGSYFASISKLGYTTETVEFTVDGQDKTINVALEVLPLLFYQGYYDGGSAATGALDADYGIDYEVADNFFGVDNTIEEFVFYGLAMKFIEGIGWQEQTPAETEPFIVRFYEYQAEVLEGVMAPVTGTYQLALQDDFDHWNWGGGSFVSVFVNGVMVIEDAIMLSGDPNPKYYTFEANEGDEITTVYTPGGWADENYYAIIDPDDNIIAEEGGTWDNPGASVPGSIGGYTVFEPDWVNPLVTQNVLADVELVGPIWNGVRTLYKFSAALDNGVEMEEGWISVQIDADNGSGTWFLWLNSLDGDLLAWHRISEIKGQAGRNNYHPASLSMDGSSSFSRGPLDYDLALELYGSTEEIPAELTLNFGEGFTWFSVNVDPGSMAVNTLFTDLEPCDGDRILGQGVFTNYSSGLGMWIGALTEIDPASKYVMDLCSQQQAVLSGDPVVMEPIGLGSGFTWLGYLPQECLLINTALGDIEPSPAGGDRIVSQVGFSVYNEDNNLWIGAVTQMCPGVGYVIELTNPAVLNYPEAVAKSELAIQPVEKRKSPAGVYPHPNLRYVMTLLGNLHTEEGFISLNPNDVVYAFVDGECRGMERPMPEHEGAIFMTIGSNKEAGEQVYFKVWLDELQQLVEIRETLAYQSLGAAGTLAEPFPLTVGDLPTGIPSPEMGTFFIGEPFPNPFMDVSYLPFSLDEPSHVKLSIYNMQGQLVFTVADRHFEVGKHQLEIKRSDLLPGVYFFRMEVSQQKASGQKTGRLIIR